MHDIQVRLFPTDVFHNFLGRHSLPRLTRTQASAVAPTLSMTLYQLTMRRNVRISPSSCIHGGELANFILYYYSAYPLLQPFAVRHITMMPRSCYFVIHFATHSSVTVVGISQRCTCSLGG